MNIAEMTSKEIQAELHKRGYSLKKLADELGVKPSTVSTTVAGKSTSARITNRIEEILNQGLPMPNESEGE